MQRESSRESMLRRDLQERARTGTCFDVGGRGALELPSGRGSARASGGPYRWCTSAAALTELNAVEPAIGFAVAEGNYKHEPTALACGAAIACTLARFDRRFHGEAEVVPALRGAFIDADETIRRLSADVSDDELGSAAIGRRRHPLRGIGASLLVGVLWRHALYLAHVGECAAWSLGERPLRLTIEDTLDRRLGAETAGADGSDMAHVAAQVVLRAVGVGPESRPTLTRSALSSGLVVAASPLVRWSGEAHVLAPRSRRGVLEAFDRAADAQPACGGAIVVLDVVDPG